MLQVRDESFQHPGLKGLYACGEGAGYAGGIVSAAMDGENVAQKIVDKIYWLELPGIGCREINNFSIINLFSL